jgi:hypothetical protein
VFSGLETRYRRAGSEAWQLADKCTNSPALRPPAVAVFGQPEKPEYRAICLQRNQRFGKWPLVFSVTVN